MGRSADRPTNLKENDMADAKRMSKYPNGLDTWIAPRGAATLHATSFTLTAGTATAPGDVGKVIIPTVSGLTFTLPTTTMGQVFKFVIPKDGLALTIDPTATTVGIDFLGRGNLGEAAYINATDAKMGDTITVGTIRSYTTTSEVALPIRWAVLDVIGFWRAATATGLAAST